MTEEKEKKLCVDCKTNPVFQGELHFKRCFSCARIHNGKMYRKLIAMLNQEQREQLKEYRLASFEFKSMAGLN